MNTPTAPRYAGLDGLRAVAVLLVVLYHLFPTWFLNSGFVGVDAFFVISGFLITSLLLRERAATGRIALGAFWARRARRLVPALVAVVTICASAAWLIGGDVLLGVGRQVLGAATFSYNWLAIAGGSTYFSAGEPELFRNLWSLAVEEQFYLVWPLLLPVLLLARRRGLRVGAALVLAACSAAWAFGVVAGGGSLTRAYYGTDTHAFGLLIGVALAFALDRTAGRTEGGSTGALTMDASPRPVRRGPAVSTTALTAVGGVAALAGLVAVACLPDGATVFPAVPLLASILTAAVIAAAVSADSPLGRALDLALLRWIGERSYGIYLWHWPVVVLLTVAVTGTMVDTAIPLGVGIATLIVTVAAAAASYRLLEQPVRRLGVGGALRALRARLASNPVRRFGAITLVAAAALGTVGTAAAVAAAPTVSSSESVVQAGLDALAEASAAPAPAGGASAPADGGAPEAGGPRGTIGGGTPGSTGATGDSGADGGTAPADGALPPALGAAGATGATAPSHDPDGRPRPPARTTVPGDRITAVGDSVMLASAEGLLDERPGIQIDAAVSRSMWQGGEIVEALAAQGALRDYVVVGLGTNGPVDDDDLKTVYDAVGPHRCLVLVNAYAPRDWISGVNTELTAFAASHPRVAIADWSRAIAPKADLLAGDQIHPGSAGGAIYADTVAGAVDALQNRPADIAYRVGVVQWTFAQSLRHGR